MPVSNEDQADEAMDELFARTDAEARQVQRWITHEVLPSIRRTGAYRPDLPPNVIPVDPTKRREMHRLLTALLGEVVVGPLFETTCKAK